MIMMGSAPANSFESLVQGISSEERRELLQKLKKYVGEAPRPMPIAKDEVRDTLTLANKLSGEPLLYRILLWIRAIFTQQTKEEIYNYDLVNRLSRSISSQHPGIMDGERRLLCTVFLEKLKGLKECADFFTPYMGRIAENRGEFYVFMSTLITPEIAEAINEDADPYSVPFDRTLSADTKSSLVHKLNDVLDDISDVSKQQMRASVACIEWLRAFSQIRFEHFISLFTRSGTISTCMFNYAKNDYAQFAKVLSQATTVSDKVLDALFLFSLQNSEGESTSQDAVGEKELQEFALKATTKLSSVQMFVNTVPVVSIGKVIWRNYEWNPEVFGGGEDWQNLFRARWREVFDKRWSAYLNDRKRKEIEGMIKETYGINQFPSLSNRPWESVNGLQFRCEMTAAFIVWFAQNEWPIISPALETLMMEGVFVIGANQNEFSVSLNETFELMAKIKEFALSLETKGAVSIALNKLVAERTNTINWQAKLASLMVQSENNIKDLCSDLCKQCRTMERIFCGIFNDGVGVSPEGNALSIAQVERYDTIRNLGTIKGIDNSRWRQTLERARKSLDGARRVLSEIEPLEMAAKPAENKKGASPASADASSTL